MSSKSRSKLNQRLGVHTTYRRRKRPASTKTGMCFAAGSEPHDVEVLITFRALCEAERRPITTCSYRTLTEWELQQLQCGSVVYAHTKATLNGDGQAIGKRSMFKLESSADAAEWSGTFIIRTGRYTYRNEPGVVSTDKMAQENSWGVNDDGTTWYRVEAGSHPCV